MDDPLHKAAAEGDTEEVAALIAAGADVNAKTPAAGNAPLHRACQKAHPKIVGQLLEAGADPDIKNDYRAAPLYYAFLEDSRECFELLMDYGASRVDICDSVVGTSNSLLHAAVSKNSYNIVALLIEKKYEDINILNDYGRTPLHVACRGRREEAARALLDSGADANIADKDGDTPAHDAASIGNLHILRELVEKHGADVNAVNDRDLTPLSRAVETYCRLIRHRGDAENGKLAQTIQYALDHGADPDAKTNVDTYSAKTCLHAMVVRGHEQMVEAMLKAGADERLPLPRGTSPADAARAYGYAKIAEMLEWRTAQRGKKTKSA